MKKLKRQIEMRPLDTLIPYARNARTHNETQIAQIAASIREFGWTNPVLVDGENGIIAGHARVEAARMLGQSEVPVIELDGLTKAQKKAYIVADNKLALNAGWNFEFLKFEFEELKELKFDTTLTGFDEDEIKLLTKEPDFQPVGEDEQGRLDQKKPVVCPKCGHEFTA